MATSARNPQQAAFEDDAAGNQCTPQSPPNRPKIRPPASRLEILLLLLALAGLICCFLPLALAWQSLPAIVPIHFDAAGHANGNGSKYTLLIAPLIALALTLLFVLLARFPWAFNYPVIITPENAARQYRRVRLLLRWVNVFVAWLIGAIEWVSLQAALGNTAIMSPITPALIGVALFVPIGALTLIVVWATRGR